MSNTHHWLDVGAILTFIATLIGWVPATLAPITAIATCMWVVGRTWEMYTDIKVHDTKWVKGTVERLKAWRLG